MEKRRRVLLYGKSVILGTVGASLQRNPEFEILPAVASSLEAPELRALSPDVIIYDIEASHPEAAISLLENCPNLLLIGVSPESKRVMLWSGRQLRQASTQELVQVIQEKESNSEPFERR